MANLANLLQTYPKKPRVFILSDISNEPDDAESLVRYLLYTNQFDTQGIVAVTSIWLQDRTCPEDMHVIINAYEKVVDNLNMHTHLDSPYPPPDQLRSLVRSGSSVSADQFFGFEKKKRKKKKEKNHSDEMCWLLEIRNGSRGRCDNIE